MGASETPAHKNKCNDVINKEGGREEGRKGRKQRCQLMLIPPGPPSLFLGCWRPMEIGSSSSSSNRGRHLVFYLRLEMLATKQTDRKIPRDMAAIPEERPLSRLTEFQPFVDPIDEGGEREKREKRDQKREKGKETHPVEIAGADQHCHLGETGCKVAYNNRRPSPIPGIDPGCHLNIQMRPTGLFSFFISSEFIAAISGPDSWN